MNELFQHYSTLYNTELLGNVIPFWTTNSIDHQFGGYFTCLDRRGEVYDTDKFLWLQARQVWTFSMLYNRMEKKEEWLKIAENGIRFLKNQGRDHDGHFYFSTTREGRPLTQAYSIYTDCFAAVAFGAYAIASGNGECRDLARTSFDNFLKRKSHPKGQFEKSTGFRPLQSFGLPMMTAWMVMELTELLDHVDHEEILEQCMYQVLKVHRHPDTGLIHEHVGLDGQFVDSFEGRMVNPGHGIEAVWFLTDVALYMGNQVLVDTLADLCLDILKAAWDPTHGGIFYFMDSHGHPPQQLEWDRKLWWVHNEALIALSKFYLHTRREDVWKWYQLVHNYSWKHFPDPEYGEWMGYLDRQGNSFLSLKGGKWKGCFHVPRALYKCHRVFEQLSNPGE